MLIDARTLPADEILETEVAIVGAGPVGITLARELIGQDFRVMLIESGSIEFNEETQSLREGIVSEETQFFPYHQRTRQYGGTSNQWSIQMGDNKLGVRYAPLDNIDFEKRDWVPDSGWVLSKSELNSDYEKAQKVCQIGSFNYEGRAWEDKTSPSLHFQGDRITTTIFQFGYRDIFKDDYKKEIDRASNLTTCLNSNVVEIETEETAQNITRLRLVTLDGKQFWVKAKIYILAAGGIENARLLLLSDRTQKTGLGNQNDLVGRYFMDHFMVSGGKLIPSSPQLFNQTALYDLRWVKGTFITGKLSLTEETLRQEKLLNCASYLVPRYKHYYARMRVMDSLEIMGESLRRWEIPIDVHRHLGNFMAGLEYASTAIYRKVTAKKPFFHAHIAIGGWSNLPHKEQEFTTFEIQHLVEVAPHRDNRVMLSQECDRIGCRKVKVDFRMRDIDIQSLRRTQEILKEDFANSGLGEFALENEEMPYLINASTGSSHHIGATRMHSDPKQGVVDANCQVHGISNLFIAGSSVFPTGSYVNPTLTAIALAIRLSDRVKSVMSSAIVESSS